MLLKNLTKTISVLPFLLISTQFVKAQQHDLSNAIPYAQDRSFSLSTEDHSILIFDINIKTRQGNGYYLFVPPKDSISDFTFEIPSPTLLLKKSVITSLTNDEIKQFDDILNVDLKSLRKQLNTQNQIDNEFLNSYFGYYGLREKNVFQVGTSCFIGTIDDLKKGNYSVIGINTYDNEVIYYLAFYEKKLLQKVHLSNGYSIGNFTKNYDSYSIAASDQDEQTYLYETYSKGNCTKATISSKKDDFYIEYDHGGYDLSYLFPDSRQTNFKVYEKPGDIFIYKDNYENYRYYSRYGRSVVPIQFLGDPSEKPMTLNFGKFNDPNGESVTIGEYKPEIVAQKYVEFDTKRNIKIHIAQFNNELGIILNYPVIINRYVVMAQITDGGWINRHINISDKFNFLMGNNPVFGNAFLSTKLHKAVWNQNEDSVTMLLNQGVFVNIVNCDLQTPLHLASFKNNHFIIRHLVDSGAKVYFPDHYGNTPLHIAAAFGDNETINFLFDAGKSEEDEFGIKGINISNKSMETPLDLAILNNNLLTVQALLDLGAYTGGWNQYGQSPLKIATYKLNNSSDIFDKTKSFEIVKALVNATKWYKPNSVSVPTISENDSLENVFVRDLKFFESSEDITPYNKREYKKMFASTKTRFINSEITINYPLQNSKKTFSIKAIWYNANGKEIFTDNKITYVDSTWTSSYHTITYGNNRFGAVWKPGLYYIDFILNNQKIANAYFVVY